MSSQDQSLTKKEAKLKAARFCAYQERTQQELREKLLKLSVNPDEVEEIIAEMISENFLNEERFAKTFVSGKFRIKKWGRNKIIRALKLKGLTEYCINEGLKEIDPEDYRSQIQSLIKQKYESVREPDLFQKKHKISKFLIGKGYEPDLVWENLEIKHPR